MSWLTQKKFAALKMRKSKTLKSKISAPIIPLPSRFATVTDTEVFPHLSHKSLNIITSPLFCYVELRIQLNIRSRFVNFMSDAVAILRKEVERGKIDRVVIHDEG